MNDKILLILAIVMAFILAFAMSYSNSSLTDNEIIMMAYLCQ